jgi:hypothetical protein
VKSMGWSAMLWDPDRSTPIFLICRKLATESALKRPCGGILREDSEKENCEILRRHF